MKALAISLCAVDRFSDAADCDSSLHTVFSDGELSYCFARSTYAQSLAARFAAKKALLKALGDNYCRTVALNEIEVQNEKSGKPCLLLHGTAKKAVEEKSVNAVYLSLSHEKENAVALVVLE